MKKVKYVTSPIINELDIDCYDVVGKYVTILDIKDGEIITLATLEIEYTDNSVDAITEYLSDNGLGDVCCEIIEL